MENNLTYREELSSTKTEALFWAFTFLFLWLFAQRIKAGKRGSITRAFFCLFLFFLFYAFNYKTLIIHITAETLQLKFGVFTWTVPLDNVSECKLDEIPLWLKYGGAGIHFMSVGKRYRASFNFLEYPRVVLTFKKKVGVIVQELSFSTRKPEDVLQLIQQAIIAQNNIATLA